MYPAGDVSLGQQRLICHYACFAVLVVDESRLRKKLLIIPCEGCASIALSVISTNGIFTIEETVEARSASRLKFRFFASEVFVGTSRCSFYY
jgi:hypothetical protein